MSEDQGFCRKVVDNAGNIHYYDEKGVLHRVGGPAVETKSGYKSYWKHGRIHNLEGPAEIRANGTEAYFIEGVFYFSKKEWAKKVNEFHPTSVAVTETQSETKMETKENQLYKIYTSSKISNIRKTKQLNDGKETKGIAFEVDVTWNIVPRNLLEAMKEFVERTGFVSFNFTHENNRVVTNIQFFTDDEQRIGKIMTEQLDCLVFNIAVNIDGSIDIDSFEFECSSMLC